MNFKIGATVKIKPTVTVSYFDNVKGINGKVIAIGGGGYCVDFGGRRKDKFTYPHEIELINQQLLFSFMYKV